MAVITEIPDWSEQLRDVGGSKYDLVEYIPCCRVTRIDGVATRDSDTERAESTNRVVSLRHSLWRKRGYLRSPPSGNVWTVVRRARNFSAE